MSFELTCYFPGQDLKSFCLTMPKTAWVGELVDAIKARLNLERKHEIFLYKADIPLDPESESTLQSRVLEWIHEQPTDTRLAQPMRLDEIFPNGPHSANDGTVNIVIADIEIMSFKLSCYYPGENPEYFILTIPDKARVWELVDAIEAELDLEKRHEIFLYKADIPLDPESESTLQSRVLQWIHEQPTDIQLAQPMRLDEIFPNGPHSANDDTVNIVIADIEMRSFKLSCYYPGEYPEYFLLTIPDRARVDKLVDAIKAELGLEKKHSRIFLYKADIPLDPGSTLQSRALQWIHEQPAETHLEEPTRLDKIFPNGPYSANDDTVNIVIADIEMRSFKLSCYYPGEYPQYFILTISDKARVDKLVDAIKAELDLEKKIFLYKADIPLDPGSTLQSRVLQWIHEQPTETHLEELMRLDRIFPNGPHLLNKNNVNIVIADTKVLESVAMLCDPFLSVEYNKRLRKSLHKQLDAHSTLPSPSEAVKDAQTLEQVFGGEQCTIHIGMPGRVPAAIFHPVLARLQRSLENLEQIDVSPSEIALASEYIGLATGFYSDEKMRRAAIQTDIEKAFGGTPKWDKVLRLEAGSSAKGTSFKLNATWWHDLFLIMVFELKNSLGLQGDALLQAVIDYSKMISVAEYKPFWDYSNFPVVLIGATANRLEIAIAVTVGSTYMTKLLTLDLSFGFDASENVTRLARVFHALSSCRAELQSYYKSIDISKPRTLSCLFPDPTPIDPSDTLPKLTYRHYLSRGGQPTSNVVDLGDATTVIYLAELAEGQEVVVKFTARYNETAHRLLANAHLAPKLHFCGRVVGGLFMVVMDHLDGKSLWRLREDKTPIPKDVMANVREAVKLLHEQNIVFGDLRANNILHVRSEGGGDRAVLVDFDWPGKDGEARYPSTLNLDATTWHEDVIGYGVMQKAHDEWLLKQLEGLFTQTNA